MTSPDSTFLGRILTIRQRLTKRSASFAAALLALPALAFLLPGEEGAAATPALAQPRRLSVRTVPVEPVDQYRLERQYTGLVAARRSSDLAFERGGLVLEIQADEGDRVNRGDALARLDDARLGIALRELEARRDEAAARLAELEAGPRREQIEAAAARVREAGEGTELLRAKNARRDELLAEGVIADEEKDEFAFGLRAAQARLDAAHHRLEELKAGSRPEVLQAQRAVVDRLDAQIAATQLEIERSVLRAPFPGTIVKRRADEGAVLTAGQPLLQLLEDRVLEARVGVPSGTAAGLEVGGRYRLRSQRGEHAARARAVLPDLDPVSRTLTVILDVEENGRLHSGETVRLGIVETVPAEGFWIPSTSLVKGERGLWSCFVVDGQQRVERRQIEILHSEADRVLVQGSLADGDEVIATGVARVVPGQAVRPRALAAATMPPTSSTNF